MENPFLYVLIFIVILFAAVVGISLLIGAAVAFSAGRAVDRSTNTYQKEIRRLLPGKNCGACGFESCDGYACAVFYGNAPEDACPHGNPDLPEEILRRVNAMLDSMEDPAPPKSRIKHETLF